MSTKELNPGQVEILNSTFLGNLSTLRHSDGYISTNPVSFHWTGEEIERSPLCSVSQ